MFFTVLFCESAMAHVVSASTDMSAAMASRMLLTPLPVSAFFAVGRMESANKAALKSSPESAVMGERAQNAGGAPRSSSTTICFFISYCCARC